MRRALVGVAVLLLVGATAGAPGAARPRAEGTRPNLFAYPPSFLIGPVTGKLPYPNPTTADTPVVDGCFGEERAAGAQRCLRFLTKVVNFDVEPLRVLLRPGPSGPTAYQIVDGEERPAGTFSFDRVRREVVLDDFWIMRMWRFDGGRKVGRPVASTGLRGLCPGIRHLVGNGEMCAAHNEGTRVPMILLPWLLYAYYPPDLPGQYLEISGVPDGLYVLEIEIDPKDHIRESYERDNATCVVIRLRGNEVDELRSDYCWPRRT